MALGVACRQNLGWWEDISHRVAWDCRDRLPRHTPLARRFAPRVSDTTQADVDFLEVTGIVKRCEFTMCSCSDYCHFKYASCIWTTTKFTVCVNMRKTIRICKAWDIWISCCDVFCAWALTHKPDSHYCNQETKIMLFKLFNFDFLVVDYVYSFS